MEKTILHVDGMACDHCVNSITKALSALPGIDSVAVDLKAGTTVVEYDPAQSPLEKIKEEIEDQGYDVVG